jgi:hypothetical protein
MRGGQSSTTRRDTTLIGTAGDAHDVVFVSVQGLPFDSSAAPLRELARAYAKYYAADKRVRIRRVSFTTVAGHHAVFSDLRFPASRNFDAHVWMIPHGYQAIVVHCETGFDPQSTAVIDAGCKWALASLRIIRPPATHS